MRSPFDAVVVLGKELRRDPERARRELMARAAAAAAAIRGGATVVYTLEALLRGQADSGSAIVTRFLLELGVPRDQIVARDWTRSTREEAARASAMVREGGHRRALIVTAAYHVPRARRHFEDVCTLGEVHSPEVMWRFANAGERAWISAGASGEEALGRERKAEIVLGGLANALAPFPRVVRHGIEIAAGVAWRGTFGRSAG